MIAQDEQTGSEYHYTEFLKLILKKNIYQSILAYTVSLYFFTVLFIAQQQILKNFLKFISKLSKRCKKCIFIT